MATPADELGQTSQQIGDLEGRSGELDASYQQALADLVAVDSEVNRYNDGISAAVQHRDEIQGEIQAEQQRLDETRAQLEDQQGTLEKRLLSTYKSDDIGYLEVMMGAGDFNDFLNRVDMISIIADDDRKLIESVRDTKQSIEEKISSLDAKKNELASLISDLGSSQENLLKAQAEQQSVLAGIESQMQDNQAQLSQLHADAAAIESRMGQIQTGSSYSGDGDTDSYSPPPAGGTSFEATATAYCLGGTTATGMPVGRGIIAVDPGVIPLGSRVHVSGYGDAIAADTGGAINGSKIDVWLPCDEAYAWGVRSVTVTLY